MLPLPMLPPPISQEHWGGLSTGRASIRVEYGFGVWVGGSFTWRPVTEEG